MNKPIVQPSFLKTPNATQAYLRMIGEIPLLSHKREKELAKTIQAHKGGKARQLAIDELVSHNLRLVSKEAFRFVNKTGVDLDDLIGAGNEGLMRAAFRFNPSKFKTKFSTYATFWIREAMQDLIYRTLSCVTIPVHISNGVARHKKMLEENENVSNKEIKKKLNIKDSTLQHIKTAHIKSFSLNNTINSDDSASIEDIFEDSEAENPREMASNSDDHYLLYQAISELDETSRSVILAQYLNGDKVKLKNLGKKFSVTGERIRQIREKALKTLRNKLRNKLGKGA